ncbi:MAG: sulfite exporter TauE/SafE family protein [bacterium]
MLEWYLYPIIVGAGFLAGFINTLAGSGSLVTLPLLIFAGLPANVANGTNRVGILLQGVIGAGKFRQSNVFDGRGVFMLGIPAVLGSLVGAQIAVNLDEELMELTIGVIMLLMLGVILLRPQRWLEGELQRMQERPSIGALILFFFIGIYGGFIQAGVGIFLLAGLVLGVGYDLVRANAVKVGINLFFTVFALLVFVRNGQVVWSVGLILAIGNMLGAWAAAKVAVEKGAVWVRRLLIAVILVSAASLLGVFDLIMGLL